MYDKISYICIYQNRNDMAISTINPFPTTGYIDNTFALLSKKIKEDDIKQVCSNLLASQQATYIQFRRLLSPVQWQLLIAVAKEGKVYQPQSKDFIKKHHIGTPTNSKRALDALQEKEMIYWKEDLQTSWYQVYDVFLSR